MADSWAEQDFEERERRYVRFLRRCPICKRCGEEITDEKIININGDVYHLDCVVEEFGEENKAIW